MNLGTLSSEKAFQFPVTRRITSRSLARVTKGIYESPSRVEARCCILHICRATYSLLELDLAISEQSPYILCYTALSPSQILVSGNHRNVGMGYTTLTP
ncbi:hypothetical protein KQX54_008116 [Cotesia glomerata]|uniref:Uncharacterized protein n=1 Tax=Cotesia glomerata TaxID=32391 RepID=A0AAV7J0N6_COTGL|nr:hypothetical protein KQX54_008116 [Cotesia glomerata]